VLQKKKKLVQSFKICIWYGHGAADETSAWVSNEAAKTTVTIWVTAGDYADGISKLLPPGLV